MSDGASNKDESRSSSTLRHRAEEHLRATRAELAGKSSGEIAELVTELQIHQMELEMQNEELREAQVALAHARDRYADLYDFAPVGYLTFDHGGKIQEANLTAAVMLAAERGRLVGGNFSAFVARDNQDGWHTHLREVFAGEEKQTRELELWRSDGGRLVVQLQSLAFQDENGELRQCRTAISDISERRIAHEALGRLNIDLEQSLSERAGDLDASIERVRLLSEAAAHLGEGVLITEDDIDWPGSEIIFANESMHRISGFTVNDLIGGPPRLLLGKNVDVAAVEALRYDLSTKGSHSCEMVNYRKDGTPYEAELHVSRMNNAAGRRTNFVTIYRDITERKTAERTLRCLHEFSESLVETAQNIILVLDMSGHVVRFNPTFAKLSGWTIEEAEGRDWFETFLPERDRARIRELFEKATHGERTRGNVNAIMAKSGAEYMIEWCDAILTDADGEVIGVLCSGTDVTDRLRLENEVINAAEEERLRIANDLHDDLGSLLTSIDLRLGGMTKSASVLGAEKIASDGAAIHDLVQRAIRKTRAIAKGLHPLGHHPGDLMRGLEEIVERVNSESGIQCSLRASGPMAFADPIVANHLFRIAQEAVNNAVKHSGGTELHVSLKEADGQIVLEVADNGRGWGTGKGDRAGLGLHTMNYRASAINGSLAISRRKGGGTRVVCSVAADGDSG